MSASESSLSFNRRQVLTGSVAAALAASVSPRIARAQGWRRPDATTNTDFPLSFPAHGRFKIVQFNDTQDDHLTDRRTIEFMGTLLDKERPHFVLINGDVISAGPKNDLQVYQALNNVVRPMEDRGIPWAVTFGNHDEDAAQDGDAAVFEPQMVNFLRQYRFNLNPTDSDGLFGSSNGQLLIRRSNSEEAAFAVWLLDSGRYAPQTIAGQSTDHLMAYDWIRHEQIQWYREQSARTEQRFGAKIPGLMYFHIPTHEHHHMWFGSQFESDDAKVAEAKKRHQIEGVRHEGNYTGLFNSGIFAAAMERGDIRGMYCGHDHINTYKGNYFGIELGYGPGTGFGPYGLHDGTWDQHTLRGARIFELDENTEEIYTSTRLVFAKDYGIDMNPAEQLIDAPLDFPTYVEPRGDVAPATTSEPVQPAPISSSSVFGSSS